MDTNIKEELMYLLRFTEDYIENSLYKVVNDSETDPHFSAVTTSNLIKCYVKVIKNFGGELPYTDVKSFFNYNLMSEEEYNNFEKRRSTEKEYYVGKIF